MVNNQEEAMRSLLSLKKNKQKSDVFGEGELWVKLQFPKEEEGVGVGDQKMGFENKYDQMNEYSSNMKRVCHICYKVFSSGKALGGHMRIHVLGAKKKDLIFKEKRKVHQTIKFKKQNPREDAVEKAVHFVEKKHHPYKKMTTTGNCFGVSDEMVKSPSCIICGKNFPSMKSLFGHMRCHPEREWRGIHPPPSMEKISSSSSSSLLDAEPRKFCGQMELSASGAKNRAVDLTESLRGWPVTAKRGRKAMAVAASSSEFSCSDDDQFRAVTYLMMLASGHLLESGVAKRQNSAESQAAESFCEAKILEIDQVSKSKKFETDYPVEQLGKELRDSSEFETVDMAGSGLVRGESVNKLEGQEWLDQEHDQVDYFPDDDQLDNMIPGQLNDKGFETTCNFKVPIKNKKKRKKLKLCELELVKSASPTMHQNPPEKFQCKTCDKAFPSHQALGGHMSSHYKLKLSIQNTNGTAQVKETKRHIAIKGLSRNLVEETQHQCKTCDKNFSTAQAPSGQVPASEDTQICRIMLDIDLNEAPPSEGEAGVGSEVSTYTW
ncbi:UNVERIFIED_CONTAM: Zinc finger protein ZAT2 [Sesamum angustifolium]|uniref:Zinc finger protein ZAT2 n=1 Tax=Sesamum angustifolium TaxID=2727405 RepID=A0AAW2PE96_9LAMI